MIASLREAQREDAGLYARGLSGWFHGAEDENAIAAGREFCETLTVLRQRAIKG